MVASGGAQPDEQRAQRGPVEPQVPTSWIAAAHQSIRRCRIRSNGTGTASVRCADGGRVDAASVVLQERGRREEDGPDEVGQVVGVGADGRGVGGNEPSAKQMEPMANSTPIHHAMACGAHQVEPSARPGGCLRCHRDSHVSSGAVGRRKISRVTNGPRPRASQTPPTLGDLDVAGAAWALTLGSSRTATTRRGRPR